MIDRLVIVRTSQGMGRAFETSRHIGDWKRWHGRMSDLIWMVNVIISINCVTNVIKLVLSVDKLVLPVPLRNNRLNRVLSGVAVGRNTILPRVMVTVTMLSLRLLLIAMLMSASCLLSIFI